MQPGPCCFRHRVGSLPTTLYKGLIVSLLHLLVPLVAGTQRGGGVINELVAYYTEQWGSWQRGLKSKCGVREGWLAFLET